MQVAPELGTDERESTNGHLTQAQAAGGQTLTFAYTSGALTRITDPMSDTTQFAYTNNRACANEANGNKIGETVPLRNSTY